MDADSVRRSRVLGSEFDSAILGTAVNGFGRRVVVYDEAGVTGIMAGQVQRESGGSACWPTGSVKVWFRADWARERVGEWAPVMV